MFRKMNQVFSKDENTSYHLSDIDMPLRQYFISRYFFCIAIVVIGAVFSITFKDLFFIGSFTAIAFMLFIYYSYILFKCFEGGINTYEGTCTEIKDSKPIAQNVPLIGKIEVKKSRPEVTLKTAHGQYIKAFLGDPNRRGISIGSDVVIYASPESPYKISDDMYGISNYYHCFVRKHDANSK